MKYLLYGLVWFACFAFLAGTASAACDRKALSGSNAPIPISNKIDQSLLNKAVLIEVNVARCKAGLPSLSTNSSLTKAAANHSKWMAKNGTLSHNSSIRGQNSTQNRIKSTGIDLKTGAENIIRIARYQLSGGPFFVKSEAKCTFADSNGNLLQPHNYNSLAREAVRQWVKSPVHRKNFMHNRMRLTATAGAVDPSGPHCGSVYLTQLFLG